ncbi:hypothetical protein, partial [uncultured Brevundimonas sp.]|uniref:hypothetical protein n=1 Tax=uncultured Brevundimonas sp. TaxID=213418 RepID=UPI0025E671EE
MRALASALPFDRSGAARLGGLSLLLLALPVCGRPNVVQLVFGKLLHLLDAAGSQHLRTTQCKL